MAWADLSPEQQGIVAEYTRQMRAAVGDLARLLNRFEALDNMYDGQVVAAWTLLDNADLILDGSGLAGVSTLAKAEVAGIAVYFIQPMLTNYNTEDSRRNFVKIAGMVNTI